MMGELELSYHPIILSSQVLQFTSESGEMQYASRQL